MLPSIPRNKLEHLDLAHIDAVDMFHRFEGQHLTSELCKRLARNLHFALKESPDCSFIFQTLMQYEGQELTTRWCNLLARQLIARSDELQAGVLQLFDRPVRDEWVALEAYEAEECVWREDQLGALVTFHCLTGHPAGHFLTKKFPESWMVGLAYRIGYSRRLPYDYDIRGFIGLRIWGYLLASQRGPSEFDFEDWAVDRKMKRSNQAILKRRLRFEIDLNSVRENTIEEYSCPFDKEIYCSDCRCTVRECNASYSRERTYDRGPVVGGGTSDH